MKIIRTAVAAIAAIFTLSLNSCLKTAVPETSPKAAITSMTLGYFYVTVNDVNYARHDTTVMVYQGGDMYPITIDQISNRIYNVDSLAYGSVLTSVTCNISSAGTVLYKYSDVDEGFCQWDSKDPIDFSRPLKFYAVSSDETYLREYSFQLNIHTVHPDSVSWTKSDAVGYTPMSNSAAVVMGDTLYYMGIDGSGNPAVATHYTRNGNWNSPVAMTGLDGTGWTGMVNVFGGTLLTVCGGQLFGSSDAVSWHSLKSGVDAIISAGQNSPAIWVRTAAGRLEMSEDLSTWTLDQNVPADFPDSIVSAFTTPLKTNSGITRTVLAGVKNGTPSVWMYLSNDTVWCPVITAPYSKNPLPALQSLSIIRYDGSLFAFGSGFAGFWQSLDNGANWLWCDRYFEDFTSYNNYMQFPDNLKGNMSPFAYVTDNVGCIWIMTEDGQVWRGSINRLNRR